MNGSIYYDGREDGDVSLLRISDAVCNPSRRATRAGVLKTKQQSPVLSPLTPNFDRYVSRGSIDDPYFPDTSFVPLQSESYTMGAPSRGSVDARESGGFSLDFLPTGDTVPRAYPGTIDPSIAVRASPNPTWDVGGSPGLYPERDSSEELRFQQQYGPSFDAYGGDGYGGFVTSPADVSYGPSARDARKKSGSSATSGSSDKKKRKHHASKDKDGDEKPHRSSTQLRTASRAPKRYSQSTSRRPAESVEEVKARAAHNQVEQQYRKRLNQQFERLLAVLPQPDYDDEGEDADMGDAVSSKGGSMDKRISKAEVLDLARRRIKTLEKERASLERQKRDLASSVVRLQDEWTRRLGGLPVKAEVQRD
jgi:hypothetical protein